ncbi:MAG: hypothetical protein ACJA13_001093 [Paraglaciecola sp.]|jgi:hypothetical protein
MKYWAKFAMLFLLLVIVGMELFRQYTIQQWADVLQQYEPLDKAPSRLLQAQSPTNSEPKVEKRKSAGFSLQHLPLPLINPTLFTTANIKNSPNDEIQDGRQTSAISVKPRQGKVQQRENRQQPLSLPLERSTTNGMYQQLSEDTTLVIELMLPHDPQHRARLFSYFYECAGVAFGIFHSDKVEVLSGASNRGHSHWLRVAQGELNYREMNWLKGVKQGQAVRLFPKELDWQLAQRLSQQLGTSTLQMLSGEYQLQASGVYLRNININGKGIDESWQLSGHSCAG